MKYVFDTNVIVAGLSSKEGASYQLLKMLPKKRFTLLLSVALFLEYETVLKRGKRKLFLSTHYIDAVLDYIAAKATVQKLYFLWRPMLKDPNDDMVLELAVAGKANAIVTFNEKDFKHVQEKFGIEVITPKVLYKRLTRSKK